MNRVNLTFSVRDNATAAAALSAISGALCGLVCEVVAERDESKERALMWSRRWIKATNVIETHGIKYDYDTDTEIKDDGEYDGETECGGVGKVLDEMDEKIKEVEEQANAVLSATAGNPLPLSDGV